MSRVRISVGLMVAVSLVATATFGTKLAIAATAPSIADRTATVSGAVNAAAVDRSGPYGSMRRTGSSGVALTFDDGPDKVVTVRLLNLLKKHKVKATFCVVGHRARDNPAIIRRMAKDGHTFCNHSWQHLQNLGKLSDAKIRTDLKATNKWIRKAVPGARIQYFRAPYGNFTARLNRIAVELGMTPLSWLVDDHSYMSPKYGTGKKMIAHIVKRVQTYTRKGSIVLSHEMLKPWTVTAYGTLLPWLKKRFTLVPMPTKRVQPPTKPVPPPPPPPETPVVPVPTEASPTASASPDPSPPPPAATPQD